MLILSLILSWTTPINISNTDSMSTHPALCMDKRGWLHCVWEEKVDGSIGAHGINDIYYTRYNGSTWSTPINVSNDSFASWDPDVAVDTLNRIHIVWGNYETGKIMWTMFEGDTWTTPVSISDAVPYGCVAPELAVNPLNNYVHCVWHDMGSATTECEIWHTYFDGDTWSIPENVTNDPSRSIWPDVAVDSLGKIHLVWEDGYSSQHNGAHIYYTRYENGSWLPFVDISPNCIGTVNPRIAIDRNNNPRVVWEERGGSAGYEVYYTYFDGIEWVNPVLVDTNISIKPVLTVDKDNRSHIAWGYANETYDTSDVFYTAYTDTTMEFPPENVSSTDSASGAPCITVDNGLVHLVWVDCSEGDSVFSNWEIYYSQRELSGIKEKDDKKVSFSLPSITVRKLFFTFYLSEPSSVYVSFYDLAGRKVNEISLGFKGKGTHQCGISLDLPSGVCFLILKAGTQTYRGKIIFIKP